MLRKFNLNTWSAIFCNILLSFLESSFDKVFQFILSPLLESAHTPSHLKIRKNLIRVL